MLVFLLLLLFGALRVEAAQTPSFDFRAGALVTAPGHTVLLPLSASGAANLAEGWQVDLRLTGDQAAMLVLQDAQRGQAVPEDWIFASHAADSEPVVRTIAVSSTSDPALLEGELALVPLSVLAMHGDETSVTVIGPDVDSRTLPGGVGVVGDRGVMFELVSVAPGSVTVARCGNLTYQEDGLVHFQDLLVLLATLVGNRGPVPGYVLLADVTRDGRVNVLDAIRLLQHISDPEGRSIAPGACGLREAMP